MKTTYDSFIKLVYCLGLEKRLLNTELRDSIPRSTASTWRAMHVDQIMDIRYSGEVRKSLLDFVRQQTQFSAREIEILKLTLRFRNLFTEIFGGKELHELLRLHKSKVIKWIESASGIIELDVILRILNLRKSTFHQWSSEVRYFCLSSPLSLCSRTFPFQLTTKELTVIKTLLDDKETEHWSIASIHGMAFKTRQLNISRATMYRYNKRFGFRRKRVYARKPDYHPIRASRPNEIWHADISVFVTEDGKRHYIYAIIDNYSRKILEWDISGSANGATSRKVLRKALMKCETECQQYITDAGTENTNWTVRQYLNSRHASIVHSIALCDIRQSNSMIEAVFRAMKSGYLYYHRIRARKQLFQVMHQFVLEYNEVKPHYSQQYYTPSEIYTDRTDYIDVKGLYSKARNCRFRDNKNCECEVCISDMSEDQ